MASFGRAIFGTWRVLWLLAILCCGCRALSSSSSLPSSSLMRSSYPSFSSSSMVCIAKTKETFKLSELQYLAARIEALQRPQSYNLTRLIVDPATGSSIFRMDVATTTTTEVEWPFSWRRCEWIAEVLVEGDTAAQLLERTERQHPVSHIAKGWTLDYHAITRGRARETGALVQRDRKKPPAPFTSKTLICSIAHVLPTAPALNPAEATDRLVVLEMQGVAAAIATTSNTEHDKDSDPCGSAFYLTRVVYPQTPLRPTRTPASSSSPKQSSVEDQWSSRPFQYSSAMNMDIAKIVVETLMDMVVHHKIEPIRTNEDNHQKDSAEERPLRMLDPTCGSGTFLAIALELGMQVEGFDINPKCVNGTVQNLQQVFGLEHVHGHARIRHLDSSRLGGMNDDHVAYRSSPNVTSSNQKEWGKIMDIDCVVANLPWGVSSFQYKDENSRILQAVRNRLEFGSSRRDGRGVGTPCAFVTKESDPSLFEAAGFEVLGEAHVPPRDFDLPEGNKKNKRLSESGRPTTRDDSNPRNYRNNCVVTFARTK